MSEMALEQIKQLAAQLSRPERTRLAEWIEETLGDETTALATTTMHRRPLYGLCADLGSGPTDEDIEEVRREMWANFPREDIAPHPLFVRRNTDHPAISVETLPSSAT